MLTNRKSIRGHIEGGVVKKITIKTKNKKELVDITDELYKIIDKDKTGRAKLCHIFLPHSTAGLTTAYLNPESELDLIDAFDVIIPHTINPLQKHDHSHALGTLPDHIVASFLGTSLTIPIVDGKLALGGFQRVVVVELNGPRERTVMVSCD